MNILVTISPDRTRDTFIPADIVSRIEGMGNVVWNESEQDHSLVGLHQMGILHIV